MGTSRKPFKANPDGFRLEPFTLQGWQTMASAMLCEVVSFNCLGQGLSHSARQKPEAPTGNPRREPLRNPPPPKRARRPAGLCLDPWHWLTAIRPLASDKGAH